MRVEVKNNKQTFVKWFLIKYLEFKPILLHNENILADLTSLFQKINYILSVLCQMLEICAQHLSLIQSSILAMFAL